MIYDFENNIPNLHKDSWVASNAVLIGKVILKKDTNIWFNVVLRGDIEPITIGEKSNVQDGCVFHTDPGCPLTLGRGITVGHMVMLHGCETKIGKNCIIGANTLIAENKIIPDRSLVLGSPGKIIRQVTDKEIEEIKENAKHYVENCKRYKK